MFSRVRAAQAWLAWDQLGSSVLACPASPALEEQDTVHTAAIGLHLYTCVPNDPRYASQVLQERAARTLGRGKVPLQLVSGRWG